MKIAVPKSLVALFAILVPAGALAQPAATTGQESAAPDTERRPSGAIQQKVAPGLAGYTDQVLFGEVWPGSGLSPRDRSLVVISVLIATHKPAQLQGHLRRALDNGVTPLEASGVLTHLSFYAGWPSVVSALDVFDTVYTERKVDTVALQDVRVLSASIEPPAGFDRVRASAPRYAELTERVIFGDLWRRSDLGSRDRSLVTIAALAAMGDADRLTPYLNTALAAGLTRDQLGEALTHLAFYAGWAKAETALNVVAATAGPATQPPASSPSPPQRISRKGAGPTAVGPAANFTGKVRVSERFRASVGSPVGGATVTFEPGARSAWHRHPMGQTLIVTEGCGWTQVEGGPIQKICSGDVAWAAPGEKHWHGATSATAMSHVTVSELGEGQAVEWLEKVSDRDYERGPR